MYIVSSYTNYRSYFRCTYKDEQRCQAKKIVEQTSAVDAPFKVTYTNKHTCNFYKTISTSSSPQPISPFVSSLIEQDHIGINQMPHSDPQLFVDQGSCFVDANNNLREIFPSTYNMVERTCEWDIDPLLMDMVFVSDYSLLN